MSFSETKQTLESFILAVNNIKFAFLTNLHVNDKNYSIESFNVSFEFYRHTCFISKQF